MKTPWDMYMKVGIVHPMAFPETLRQEGPVFETIRRIAEDEFFGAIDIVGSKDPKVRKEVGALLKYSRLQVNFAAQSVLLPLKGDLNAEDPEARKRAIQIVKECVDHAVDLNASSLSILSGYDPGPNKREKAMELLIDSIKQICHYAREKAGIPVALKIFDREIEKKALIGPVDEAKKLAEAIRQDYPDFGLVHDLSHLPLLGEEPAKALPVIKDYLVAMHMGNCVLDKSNPLYGDQHPLFGVPGGVNDIEELRNYLKTLFEIGFLKGKVRRFVGFEIKPHAGVTSEMVIANAKRTLTEAWAGLEISQLCVFTEEKEDLINIAHQISNQR
jgi:sugar phosphate isomerase/epimerase